MSDADALRRLRAALRATALHWRTGADNLRQTFRSDVGVPPATEMAAFTMEKCAARIEAIEHAIDQQPCKT